MFVKQFLPGFSVKIFIIQSKSLDSFLPAQNIWLSKTRRSKTKNRTKKKAQSQTKSKLKREGGGQTEQVEQIEQTKAK